MYRVEQKWMLEEIRKRKSIELRRREDVNHSGRACRQKERGKPLNRYIEHTHTHTHPFRFLPLRSAALPDDSSFSFVFLVHLCVCVCVYLPAFLLFF